MPHFYYRNACITLMSLVNMASTVHYFNRFTFLYKTFCHSTWCLVQKTIQSYAFQTFPETFFRQFIYIQLIVSLVFNNFLHWTYTYMILEYFWNITRRNFFLDADRVAWSYAACGMLYSGKSFLCGPKSNHSDTCISLPLQNLKK